MTEAILADGLERRFGPVEALRGLSFTVAEGELYGLVGPDAAGKTTAIRALAGLIDLDRGAVRILGADPFRHGRRVRESLGLMPQYYSLYGDLTVAENLRFFGRLFGLARRVQAARVERLLAITRLAPFLDRRADALSGGMYKKLALACALLHEPRVLLLDEPTNGVDPVSRRELWELLYEFVADGMAVLVSTPYMDEAERCHRVGLVHGGALLAEGTPRELVREADLEAVDVRGGARLELEAMLAARPEVVLVSPAAARLHVVLRPGSASALARALAPHGATVSPSTVGFEDLFLARLGRSEERAA